MKALIDSRAKLARGFSDANTPSRVEKELLFTWQEKKDDLLASAKLLQELIVKENDPKLLKQLKQRRKEVSQQINSLGAKMNKMVDIQALLIDRLRQACSQDVFNEACVLAKQDKKRILSQIHIEDSVEAL